MTDARRIRPIVPAAIALFCSATATLADDSDTPEQQAQTWIEHFQHVPPSAPSTGVAPNTRASLPQCHLNGTMPSAT